MSIEPLEPLTHFTVQVERSAVNRVEFMVAASSQDEAESRIAAALDGPTRIELEDLIRLGGVALISEQFIADDESSWEVV